MKANKKIISLFFFIVIPTGLSPFSEKDLDAAYQQAQQAIDQDKATISQATTIPQDQKQELTSRIDETEKTIQTAYNQASQQIKQLSPSSQAAAISDSVKNTRLTILRAMAILSGVIKSAQQRFGFQSAREQAITSTAEKNKQEIAAQAAMRTLIIALVPAVALLNRALIQAPKSIPRVTAQGLAYDAKQVDATSTLFAQAASETATIYHSL